MKWSMGNVGETVKKKKLEKLLLFTVGPTGKRRPPSGVIGRSKN